METDNNSYEHRLAFYVYCVGVKMKAIIKPETELLAENLTHIDLIFNNKAFQFALLGLISARRSPELMKLSKEKKKQFKKYARQAIKSVIFEKVEDSYIIALKNANPTKKQLLQHVEELVIECDGTMNDVSVEVLI